MTAVVLDAEAFSALADTRSSRNRKAMRFLEAARRLRRPAIVPTVILAELYRGPARNALTDALLSREENALTLRDTDRNLARLVGSVLAGAGVGSEHLADAHVIAAGVEQAGGVIVTADPSDMEQLAAPYRFLTVETI